MVSSAESVNDGLPHDDLPNGLEHVRTTDVFDQHRHPAGLLRAHRVADGVWAQLVVHTGQLEFVFEDDLERPISATSDRPIVIPPGRLHHVTIIGPVTFAIEFHREPDDRSVAEGSESTGLADPDPAATSGLP